MSARRARTPAPRRGEKPDVPAPVPRSSGAAARLVPWLLLALVLALVVVVRWRLLDVPLERDEGEYAYAGQLMLRGIPPYQLAYNMKLPGTYAMYAVFLALFGQTVRGVHLGLLLANAIAIVLLFRLAQRLFGATAALTAAATYALLSVAPEVRGIFAHATHLIVPWALAGFLALLTALQRGRRRDLVASGLFFGLAFLMKQHAVFFVLFGAVVLVAGRPAAARRSRVAADLLVFAGAAVLPFALTCVALALAGVFPSFWFWVFRYALAYVSEVPLTLGWDNLRRYFVPIVLASPFLWALAAAGLAVLLADRTLRERRFVVVAFLTGAALAVCPGLHFREHYFVVLLPAVALLAGVAMDGARRALARALPGAWAVAVAAALFLAVFALSFAQQADFLLRVPPARIARAIYGPNPFPEAVEIARYIAARSSPADRIAVLGSEPEIYFYANRLSATGHVYMYGLMEDQPYAHTMQRQLFREIEAHAPAWVVFVGVTRSWAIQTYSDQTIFDWATRYLSAHYTPVGVAEIESPQRTDYRWRGAEPLDDPRADDYLVVYRRNRGG